MMILLWHNNDIRPLDSGCGFYQYNRSIPGES
jgi:hypothetical protein